MNTTEGLLFVDERMPLKEVLEVQHSLTAAFAERIERLEAENRSLTKENRSLESYILFANAQITSLKRELEELKQPPEVSMDTGAYAKQVFGIIISPEKAEAINAKMRLIWKKDSKASVWTLTELKSALDAGWFKNEK